MRKNEICASCIAMMEEKYSNVKNYNPPRVNKEDIRLNLNENLFGPSNNCLEVLKSITRNDLSLYSLEDDDLLVNSIAEYLSVDKGQVLVHNGSSEMIRMILEMTLDRGEAILLPTPGWCYYSGVAKVNQYNVVEYNVVEREDSYIYDVDELCRKIEECNPKVVVIASPNMPTGNSIMQSDIERLVTNYPNQLFVIDQAYWGYAEDGINVQDMISNNTNVIFVRTFSKFFGLANERIGFSLCHKSLHDIFCLDQPLFRLSYTARMIAKAALEDTEYYDWVRETVAEEKKYFIEEMNKIENVTAYESNANFVYVKIDGRNVAEIQKKLEEEGYLIRMFDYSGVSRLRVTIYNHKVMEHVVQAFQNCV